jgi:hypothetical protein
MKHLAGGPVDFREMKDYVFDLADRQPCRRGWLQPLLQGELGEAGHGADIELGHQ